VRTSARAKIGGSEHAYLQGECSYRHVDSVRRFNVGRVLVLKKPLAWIESPAPHGRDEKEPIAVNAAKSDAIAAFTVAVVEAPSSGQCPAFRARHCTGWR